MQKRLFYFFAGLLLLLTLGAFATPAQAYVKADGAPVVHSTDKRQVGVKAPKGMPDGKSLSARAACTTTCYTYAARLQNAATGGTTANMWIGNPFCSSTCYHSLGEMAVQNIGVGGGQGNTVEIGWTKDPTVCSVANGADPTKPCLFVFSWINGVPQSYNGGTWVDNAANPIDAGDTIPDGVSKNFQMVYDSTTPAGGGWWGKYDGQWIGHFPVTATWGANGFVQSTKVQWFTELAHSTTVPCSDEGTGQWGSVAGGLSAVPRPASFASVSFFNGPPLAMTTFLTNSAWYDIGILGTTGQTFAVGGPGSGGVIGGC